MCGPVTVVRWNWFGFAACCCKFNGVCEHKILKWSYFVERDLTAVLNAHTVEMRQIAQKSFITNSALFFV